MVSKFRLSVWEWGMMLWGGMMAVNAAEIPYGVPNQPWEENLGNHRVRIQVPGPADAVRVHIPWRRPDPDPQNKDLIVVDAATGQRIDNVVAVTVHREAGDLVFQPATAPGEYFVYYLPFQVNPGSGFNYGKYAPAQVKADPEWVRQQGLTPEELPLKKWQELPEASVVEFQARTDFDRFDPMEVGATPEELAGVLARYPGKSYLVFPEDRKHPVRRADLLPLRWVESGPGTEFRGEAYRNEFYAFQIGLYAATQPLEDVQVGFPELRPQGGGDPIPAAAFRCFNLGGVDEQGNPFQKRFTVGLGRVGVLWCGVQIPETAETGTYQGLLTIRPGNAEEQRLTLSLSVQPEVLADRGDSELWRHSRLRWLDSTIAVDDEVVPPYTPLQVERRTIRFLDRVLRFSLTGFPESIRSRGRELLADPMALVLETGEGVLEWACGPPKIIHKSPGKVQWEARSLAGGFSLRCVGSLEFDGHVGFEVTLRALQASTVQDIRLEIPLRREQVPYMMGMGRRGGYRPERWEWKWDPKKNQDSVWLGGVDAGLQCKLKGENYSRPLINIHYHHQPLNLPPSWDNAGQGGCEIVEEGPNRVLLRAFSGPREMASGEEQRFDFDLLITPFHALNTEAHFRDRYYHAYHPVEKVAASGANIINIHHANELNPFINYPFLAVEKLAAYVQQAHEKNLKVKIYYTVRELTNHTVEFWALRSLGEEIFASGPGEGYAWLQEHLEGDYIPAWYVRLSDREVDASVVTQGTSRWNNYYLEGLDWLLENAGIDGLYIDDVAYGREVMKRVRKILDRRRPGSLIDFHSWNHYNARAGFASCANLYLENLPYIDRLWFGEAFDYNESPDYWLVEMSGIPFGLMGEMLQDGGNPWRGMLYGMTTRMPYSGDPSPLWKVFDEFGIGEAKMLGYWEPICPVFPSREDVLATAYVKPDRLLVAVASWAEEPVEYRLQLDWEVLMLDPERTHFYAPPIRGFQEERLFQPEEAIPVLPGRGWLLIVDEQPHDVP